MEQSALSGSVDVWLETRDCPRQSEIDITKFVHLYIILDAYELIIAVILYANPYKMFAP